MRDSNDKKQINKDNGRNDEDNIFLILSKLDLPKLRKWLIFGIDLSLILIIMDWWQPILILGIVMVIVSGSKIVWDFLKQQLGK